MGLWTYAELSTGIVISCLPVIPRFFQHIGPRVSSTLALRIKSKGSSGQEPASGATFVDKAHDSSKFKLAFPRHDLGSNVSDTSNDSHNQQIQPKGEYVMLRDHTAIPRPGNSGDPKPLSVSKLATTRNDIERGLHGAWLDRTTRAETRPGGVNLVIDVVHES